MRGIPSLATVCTGNFLVAGIVLLLAGKSAPGLETARMQLPDEFTASATAIPVSGFDGRNKGNFVVDGLSGRFERSESRLGVFDPLYASSKGKSTLAIRLADSDIELTVACTMRKKSVTVGIVTFDPKKMHVHCDYSGSHAAAAMRLDIGQPAPANMKERLLARSVRQGEALISERPYQLQSVHHYQGSKLSSQSPVGYTLMADGQLVAALELTDWNPLLYVAADIPVDMRQELVFVMLTLAVIRDPAHSALEDQADLA